MRRLVQDALCQPGRHRLARPGDRRKRRDLLPLRPNAPAARAGRHGLLSSSIFRRQDQNPVRHPADKRAAVTRSSAIRCSATSSGSRRCSPGSRLTSPSAPTSHIGADAERAGPARFGLAISRCSAFKPALGRLFTADDDRNIGNHFVTVLSHDYWTTTLARTRPCSTTRSSSTARPDDRRRRAARLFTGLRSATSRRFSCR